MSLQAKLLDWYARSGRSLLPWRTTRDPYYTLVSEFMLQQTQVDRVIPKFDAFMAQFPNFAALADATAADVLRAWRGLGYNSRALRLQAVARAVVDRFDGIMPSEASELRKLPGIGPYTAAAIRAFAFDLDEAPVDTNIRRIMHRLFYGLEHPPKATAAELDERARESVPSGQGHDWNSALMDLGATICTARTPKCLICPLMAECVAAPIDAIALDAARRANAKPRGPQSTIPFEQTTRYARGRIVDRLRALAPGQRISLLDLHRELEPLIPNRTLHDVTALITALERDGLIARLDDLVALSE